ncbi:FAD-dependent oxidoreductase [Xanthobacter dioxanivorans]|uniref:FAD-dependent oxidoreductase n=1 Tax=Xanthobacter dioxanivorans TaxID=2528964 RepID=A0A974PTZ2_9HYPH|nr:FAD-dependent oxidoreductase [Xanthobacter dioxanivorans]QRG09065.1 FAD-dependent oxidoreductase [Xanthobacter dioxanivorans]
MAPAAYDRLLSPFPLGHVTLRNRIAMMPHAVMFGAGYGSAIERTIAYHLERAKGGAGLIVMSNFLMPASWRRLASWGGALETSPLGGLDLANDRSLLPHYRRMIEAIKAEGASFVSQLNISGRQLRSPGTIPYGLPLVSPSPLACPRTAEIPREMTEDDIAEYIATMVEAALNLKEAGADGVELFAAQGYLLHEFLSPATNRRTDRYGGSLENRMRFLLDSLRAVRAAAGPDFLVGARINGRDDVPGGLALVDAVEIATRLKAEGISYLNVSGLTSLHYPAWIADITAPGAQFAPEAGAIREAVCGLPVCVSSRIATPEEAEAVLAAGQADFIGMARALISDPELPLKAARGDRAAIRVCTYSNQSCIVGLDRGRGVGCIHNPAVGREAQLGLGRMRPAGRAKRVAVVGGGPAGLAAARVAAERGHRVTLFEGSDRLGGQNLMTSAVGSRRGFAEIHRWQIEMVERLDIDIRLSTKADRARLDDSGFEAIVLATGSTPRRDGYTSLRPGAAGIDGADLPHVWTAWDAFLSPARFAGPVIVIEDDPHLAGTAAAERLAERGHAVTIVTPHMHAGADLPVHHAPALYRRLAALGVGVVPATFVTAIEPGGLVCEARYGGARHRISHDGPVILAMGNTANDALARAFAGSGIEIHVVGDALAPRQVDIAILDGERAGWTL